MDEDFVGAIAELAMRRGGSNAHKANIESLMDKYRALLDLGEIWVQWVNNNSHNNNKPITKNQVN